jgi:hypothetical protein
MKKTFSTDSPETAMLKELARLMKNWYRNRQPYLVRFHDDPRKPDYKKPERQNPELIRLFDLLIKSNFDRRELKQAWTLAGLDIMNYPAFDLWQFETRNRLDPRGSEAYIARNYETKAETKTEPGESTERTGRTRRL